MKAVLFHPEAEEEMIASAVFYETRSNGAGMDTLKNSPMRESVFIKNVYREGIAV